MFSNMDLTRFLSLGVVFLSFSGAHMISQHEYVPRQAVSNSSTTPTTTIPSTITSSASLPTLTTISSSNGTCPTSYPADYPQEWKVWTAQCEQASSSALYYNPEYADECLQSYCDWQWESKIQSYVDANRTEMTTQTRTFYSGMWGTGSLSTVVVQQTFWTVTNTFVQAPPRAVSPVAPCCNTCELSAQTVELFYWPGPTAAPNATAVPNGAPLSGDSIYVDEAGFTFISPSIYIGFTSLGAHNRCGTVGTPIYNMTMGFDPTEISSILPHVTTATCTVTDRRGIVNSAIEISIPPAQPLTMSDVAQNCSTIEGYYYFSDNPFYTAAGDPCHPVIAIPDRVKQLQPEWAGCGANYYGGFYDPPRTLGQGSVLVPTTASPGQSNPTVQPPTSSSVPALPEVTPDPKPSDPQNDPNPPTSAQDQPNPSSSAPNQPNTPSSSPDQPNPPASSPPGDQPNPPAPTSGGQSNPPATTPGQPNPPASSPPGDQPSPPAPTSGGQPNPPAPPPGSSTTIILTPPQSNPTNPPINPPPNASGPQPGRPPVITLPPNPTNPSAPGQVITILPTTLPPNPNFPQEPGSSANVVVIGSTTLTPAQVVTIGGTTTTGADGQTTVISGTQVVLDPQGTQLIIDGTSTIPLTISPAQTNAGVPPVITLGSTTLTANSATQFVLDSTTLSVGGGPITVSGTTYILTTDEQGSTQLVVGTAGGSSTSTTRPVAPENSVAAAAGLKNSVEVFVTVVLVAVLLG